MGALVQELSTRPVISIVAKGLLLQHQKVKQQKTSMAIMYRVFFKA
jgi:hypothetical protein